MTFGPLVTGRDVRHAVLDTIRWWSPTYLSEVGRRAGLGDCALDEFNFFATPADVDQVTALRPPGCSVVETGLLEEPERTEDGLSFLFGVEVTTFVSAKDIDATNDLSSLYHAAVVWLLVQQPTLGRIVDGELVPGAVRSTRFLDASPPDVTATATFGGRTALFAVEVDVALDPLAGPRARMENPCIEPDDDPLAEDFTVIEHPLTTS